MEVTQKQFILEINNLSTNSTYNKQKELSKFHIEYGTDVPIILQNKPIGGLYVECSNISIFKGDYIGKLEIENKDKRILILGFLEQIDQSPSALHIRLISLN